MTQSNNWTNFQMPSRLNVETESLTDRYGKFFASPFERGFGTTIGNSIRRALLSSIEGAAITAVKIEQLGRGQRMQEILKQPQYQPTELENQVMIIFAGTNGFADGVALNKMAQWQADLIRYMATSYPEIGKDIIAKKAITDNNRAALMKVLEAFRAGWLE